MEHSHTHYFGSTPRDYPCPFKARLDCAWNCGVDLLLIGYYLVLLVRGTRRSCVDGERSRCLSRYAPRRAPVLYGRFLLLIGG
ncbi:unnamed protein product [Ectocarpus sp. 12 AP-2014]